MGNFVKTVDSRLPVEICPAYCQTDLLTFNIRLQWETAADSVQVISKATFVPKKYLQNLNSYFSQGIYSI